ncbi:HIRAN domain-containing protein [Priestia aryabhattai]|uniref:HIRAN domain-containing protein n=1 Tax=Priestia aryabhattai TaxID=412384 RepID=UPI00159B9E3F|nr:HIRAN domain-containing protein [Priestia aryabhattai]
MSEKKFTRIEGGWKNVPGDKMKTKTQLNEMGFKPSGEPIGEVWSHKVWIQLYDPNEVIPKRKPSEKQLAALKKARKQAEENRTCQRCKEVQSKKYHIWELGEEKLCESCYYIRKEEEEIRAFYEATEHETRVAGVSFDGRQEHIKKMTKRTKLKLEREPDNRYDENAIMVLAKINQKWHQIGYLHRDYAAKFASVMDCGEAVKVENQGVGIEEYEMWDYETGEDIISFLRVFIKISYKKQGGN